MSHYSVFGDNEREFVNKHANTEPAPDSCICKAHLIEAKRMCENLDFIPKWKSRNKVNTNMKHRCLFSDCQETDKLIAPRFDTVEKRLVSNQLLRIHYCYICPKHYTALHCTLNAIQPCASCGITPKQGTSFMRHSPNASQIMGELNSDRNFVHIEEDDYVCNTFYKTHLAMLRCEDATYDHSKLMQLTGSWKITLADDATDAITKAILHTMLYVADEIMHERAVLLPHVSLTAYTENSDAHQTVHVLKVGEGTVRYTTQWLLNQVILKSVDGVKVKVECIHTIGSALK